MMSMRKKDLNPFWGTMIGFYGHCDPDIKGVFRSFWQKKIERESY